jgi:hypothetical protein
VAIRSDARIRSNKAGQTEVNWVNLNALYIRLSGGLACVMVTALWFLGDEIVAQCHQRRWATQGAAIARLLKEMNR